MRNLLLAAVAACVGTTAGATTIDFEALAPIAEAATQANFYSYVGDTYTEDGFVLKTGDLDAYDFSTFGTKDSRHTGSTALYNDTPDGTIRLSKLDGGSFDIASIDLSELNGPISTVVSFVGTLLGGGTVMQSFKTDGVFGMQTFQFSALFEDVVEVTWVQDGFYHQFDNIQIDRLAAVPVPAGGVLLLTGLGALAALRRKRKA